MASQYEIEIKVLLGSEEGKERLLENMKKSGVEVILKEKSFHLNNYFIGGDMEKLAAAISEKIPEEKKASFGHIVTEGKKLSVRTRYVDEKTILFIKASIDSDTSSNGIARIEWELEFPATHIDIVDAMLLGADFEYQAKWSRKREEYQYGDTVVCIDWSAGFGHYAEFERVVSTMDGIDSIKADLRSLIQSLGFEELPQDRLERMFNFYNSDWRTYYGTDKVFIVE